ncbi:MAG: hypothetical protein OEY20_04830 [Gemmatimonadota bacterium]|nr:hypothetical protein [Gemmatimonadota bacterium]MDH4350304.1 hypothetical protein [Gemmatimonadota bacterium]MDH5196554.1 hypothetical protein [Gemmatimonadota bacterium]
MKPASLLSCIFLALVAIAHLARFVLAVPIIVGDVTFPMWPSAVATVGAGGLAIWLWREQRAMARVHPVPL